MTGDQSRESDGGSNSRKMPDWASSLFRDLIEQVQRQQDLLHLSKKGISVLTKMPGLVQVLADVKDQDDDTDYSDQLERARKEAELAQREIREGFPLLNAYAAISLWSSLEGTIRLFVSRSLQHLPASFAAPELKKLRVQLGEYESLDGEDRYFYIIDRLERELSATMKQGINRFESILKPVGFAGPERACISDKIYELQQVRNAFMHRGGNADGKLINACPWLNLKAGQPITLSDKRLEMYFLAVIFYATTIVIRAGEYFGADMEESRQSQEESINNGPLAKQDSK